MMPETPPTDEALVSRALDDADAFGQLMERYEIKLLFYVRRITGVDVPDAEDILQETFLAAWKNLRGFDAAFAFSTWIYRIARNTAYSHHRKHKTKTEKEIADDSLFTFEVAAPDDFVSDISNQMRANEVKETLLRLDQKWREVLVLRYIEDKTYDEMSDIMKVPAGTVATWLSRAKAAFRGAMPTTLKSVLT